MRILMVGRGVISTLYGWAFAKAGHEVSFLVRPGRTAELGGRVRLELVDARKGRPGIAIGEDFLAECVEGTEGLGQYDIAVLAARQEQMLAGAEQLAAAPRPALGILFFNNYWQDPKRLSSLFERGLSLWAFPRAGGAFAGPRLLEGAITGEIEIEAGGIEGDELRREVASLFASASIAAEDRADFRSWLWIHFAVSAAFIAQAALCDGGIEGLLSSAPMLADAARLSREALRVAVARGADPASARDESMVARMPPFLAGLAMKAMAARDPSMRRMMSAGPDSGALALLPLAVLSEARRLGIGCPGLERTRPALEVLAGRGARRGR
jgi:2-dehydropantoate 2-reductase